MWKGGMRGPAMGQAVLGSREWAEAEFGAVQLGDARLTDRLVRTAERIAAKPGKSLAEAWRAIRAYAKRWLIEECHKALKTGAGIERSQLGTRERLEALLGILMLMTRAADLFRSR